MSITFDDLLYCSVYGSTMALPQQSGSKTLSGVLGAGASTNFEIYFEFGRRFDSFPDPPAIYIPKPTVSVFLNSPTAPNDSSRWYKVGSNPRPFTLGSSAGDLTLTIGMARYVATSSAPALYVVIMTAYNPYGVSATITPTVISYLGYGFANS